MRALQIMVLLCFTLVVASQSKDIPLEAALLLRGEPMGFRAHVRSERYVEDVLCAGDEYKHPRSQHCCKKCLSGFRKVSDCPEKEKVTECAPCAEGQFTDNPNYAKKCKQCSQCVLSYGQILISNCTRNRNTECGCPHGQYQVKVADNFICQNCSQCDNGKETIPCRGYSDTVCACKFGFYFDHSENKCQPCNMCTTTDCQDHCPPTETIKNPDENKNITLYVVSGAACMLLIVIVLGAIHMHKKRTQSSPSPCGGLSLLRIFDDLKPQKSSITGMTTTTETSVHSITQAHGEYGLSTVLNSQILDPQVTIPLLELPDITLSARVQQIQSTAEFYRVIDSVPVLRWKEFVRRLGLSDNIIDTCEHENKHLRDAQYAMLSKWSLQVGPSGATKDVVIGVLRDMDLAGSIERILEG
ncbi:tumor necrosis factor receptor superfamily member 1A-like [Pelobates cultripes]|uniref:Tumor necrosis factor receptor superfamily member 6 n=2 Tax=Pelobates cultripes TaxID=61616 RepID=A0AAD1TAS6_PELCU|nr:tumor necrosis factor receptor superfamily member 1A-like [Pelobates cultripes]